MKDDNIQFIDAESYQGKIDDKITFKLIILEYLRKIGGYASVEFKGGYWEERPNPKTDANYPIKIYIEDTREIYSNAVEFLYDLLYPHFDNEMKQISIQIEAELKQIYNDTTINKEDNEREFLNINNRITFRTKRRDINRKLFRELSCFLRRTNYMESKVSADTID
jgi:hypothetical protein